MYIANNTYRITWTAANPSGPDENLLVDLYYIKDTNDNNAYDSGDTTVLIASNLPHSGFKSLSITGTYHFFGYVWIKAVVRNTDNFMVSATTRSRAIFEPDSEDIVPPPPAEDILDDLGSDFGNGTSTNATSTTATSTNDTIPEGDDSTATSSEDVVPKDDGDNATSSEELSAPPVQLITTEESLDSATSTVSEDIGETQEIAGAQPEPGASDGELDNSAPGQNAPPTEDESGTKELQNNGPPVSQFEETEGSTGELPVANQGAVL
jgi:hypothetical protein